MRMIYLMSKNFFKLVQYIYHRDDLKYHPRLAGVAVLV